MLSKSKILNELTADSLVSIAHAAIGGASSTLLQSRHVSANVDLHYEGEVADDVLQLTRYAFGPEISAKGPNAIIVHKGYIFVTHYSGGMDERYVRLSRKHIGGSKWVTIVFPHQHVLFRKDQGLPEEERRGDSHNYISLGISGEDDCMHLLFDMHAYTPSDFPNDFFNYRVSEPGSALVSDSEFTLERFKPKRNYLSEKAHSNVYHRVTYPTFVASPENKLLVTWRVGGSLNASLKISKYEDGKWSTPTTWNANTNPTGIYGDFRSFNGKLVMAWQRRLQSDAAEGYGLNRGIYMATSDTPDGRNSWYTDDGETATAPVRELEMFKVGEPCKANERMLNLAYVIAPNGAFHFHVRVNGKERHCFRSKPGQFIQCSHEDLAWKSLSMYVTGSRVYRLGLKDQMPVLQSTLAGEDNWMDEYHGTVRSLKFSHGVSAMAGDDTMLFYGMQATAKGIDSRPAHVLRFALTP